MEDQKNNNEEFSKDKENLEIVKAEGGNQGDDAVVLDKEHLDVKKGGNIIIGTLNVIKEPLKKRHERHYKESIFHLVADIVLVVIILALVVALLLIKFWKPQPDVTLVSAHQNQIVTSGQTETFELAYSHEGEGVIQNCSLNVKLPNNFILESVAPSNLFDKNTHTFKIGDLTAGANGKVKITGIVYGNVGGKQTVFYTFNYYKDNREYSVLNSLHYNIEDSALDLNIDVPNKVYQGVDFDGRLSLKNNSSKDMENVEVVFDKDDWNIQRAKCSLDNNVKDNVITINKILAQKTADIYISANTSKGEGNYDFDIETYIKPENERLKQETRIQKMEVKVPNFQVSATTDFSAIKAYGTANFDIVYKNGEAEELKDIKLKILPMSSDYSIEKLVLADNSINTSLNGDTITINSVKPGEEKSFSLAVSFSRNKATLNQVYGIIVESSYKFEGQNIKLRTNSQIVKVISDLKVNSRGFYYSSQGDQLGVGPIPPTVGIPTTYWVFWELNNFGNNLSGFTMSAELPSNIVWTNNTSLLAGKLRHAEIGGRVIWEIDSIRNSGGNYKAGFEVELTPGDSDVNKVMTLLSNTSFKVYDNFAEQEITGTLKNIDTNLSDDNLTSGNGKVVR